MIVAFDMQLAVGTATGIGVYQRDLEAALHERGVVKVRGLCAPWLDPWRFDRRVVWDQLLFPLAVARSRADVAHATAGTMPLAPFTPTVVTVHDMAWLRVQGHTKRYARAYFGDAMRATYRRAAAVVVDSAFSRDEYLALSGDARSPHVVYPGVDDRYAAIVRAPAAEPIALVVGTIETRKDLLTAVETAAAIPELRLIAVGPPTPYLEIVRARVAELGIGKRIELRGYVGRATLDELYARATLALVPSRYEGFGYAVAEARCAGLPFIATRGSSLTEVAQDAGLLVEPGDVGGWIEAVRAVLADPAAAQTRASLDRPRARARFDWACAAAAFEAIYAGARA